MPSEPASLRRRNRTAPPAVGPKIGEDDELLAVGAEVGVQEEEVVQQQPVMNVAEAVPQQCNPEPRWVPFYFQGGLPPVPMVPCPVVPFQVPGPVWAPVPPEQVPSAVPTPPAVLPAEMSSPALKRDWSVDCYRVHWNVDARKVTRSDTNATSPPFDLWFGGHHHQVPFKLILLPAPGNDNFKQSAGRGFIQLKCEAEVGDVPQEMVHFRLSIGSGRNRQRMRGPVAHNFTRSVIGVLLENDIWDFRSSVGEATSFMVTLEVIPAHAAHNSDSE